MPNSSVYLVKMLPLAGYFFGGEKNFGLDINTNYLIHSRLLPQQTTLLGVVRQELLTANGLLDDAASGQKIEQPKAAEELIGVTGFQIGGAAEFGIIKGLSTVFLSERSTHYYPAPFDMDYSWEVEKEAAFSFTNQERNFIPVLKGFDAKKEYTKKWIANSGASLKEEELFTTKGQVGILKKSDKASDEEGFYKQFFIHLKKNFAFTFYLKLENQADIHHLPTEKIVHFGKERSPFLMQVKKVEDAAEFPSIELSAIPPSNNALKKVVLLSDTHVSNEIYQYCDYAVTESVSFRYLKTSVKETAHYYNFTVRNKGDEESEADFNAYKNKRVKRSGRFNLLKRGSVLYVNDMEKVSALLEASKAEFRSIGYNQYIVK